MIRDKVYFSKLIKSRGWSVSGALQYWGRSYSWYHDNCNSGDDDVHNRLECTCAGLPMTKEAQAEVDALFDSLKAVYYGNGASNE